MRMMAWRSLILSRLPAFTALYLLFTIYPDRFLFFSADQLGRIDFPNGPIITGFMVTGIFACLALIAGLKFRASWFILIFVFGWMRAANVVLMQTPEWTFLVLTFFYASLRQTFIHGQIYVRFLVMTYVAINYFWFGYDKSGPESIWRNGDFLYHALHGDFFRGDYSEYFLSILPRELLTRLSQLGWLAELLAPLILLSRRFFVGWNLTALGLHIGGLLLFSIYPVSITMIFFHLWLFAFDRENPPKRLVLSK